MTEDISIATRSRDAIDAIDHQVVDLNMRVVSDGGADESRAYLVEFNEGLSPMRLYRRFIGLS